MLFHLQRGNGVIFLPREALELMGPTLHVLTVADWVLVTAEPIFTERVNVKKSKSSERMTQNIEGQVLFERITRTT